MENQDMEIDMVDMERKKWRERERSKPAGALHPGLHHNHSGGYLDL